ncbi:hypothetical protein [Hymenobacter koreensis]|uniref:Uncharacterized protein n=1 Tax=Hymenobacter koreensis TaxID=1084523 RepID=A0ABP8J6E0_9BACT
MTHDQLQEAGFLLADYVPEGTSYQRGDLYVRMTPDGTLRVFLPHDTDGTVELSSGDVFSPHILYRGPIHDIDELKKITNGWGTSSS